ncbi:cytidine deaminase-like protein [Rhizoclosmatium globosum]|uniref:Cytidine deaminase-like protein n=1 Tax=Rhizoclosmatium globosum TaxID=329046 RepID=A0A1Y2C114_9FUNG|nr:cytidine deaminase-like protein [Rhizoclosmatium globosum]|eukprot:ORY40733.1 cytidine deaminase-like protein [Rhizoclosmatium globosum]
MGKCNNSEEVDVFVAQIDPKEASASLKMLGSLFPLPESLGHLKRIRKDAQQTSVLITQTSDQITEDSILSILEKNNFKLKDNTLSIAKVSKYPPVTREQLNEWKACWPMSFHEPRKEAPIEFTDSDLTNIEGFLNLVNTTANDTPSSKGQLSIATAIVDPKTSQVISVCRDNRHRHPLQHAVMQAIAGVAEKERERRESKSVPVTTRKRKSLDSDESVIGNAPYLGDSEDEGGDGYLCTGLDAYLSREPCAMCSMALLHSRIRRVFYEEPRKDGGLGSAYKIHVHPNLNHKFAVLRVERK